MATEAQLERLDRIQVEVRCMFLERVKKTSDDSAEEILFMVASFLEGITVETIERSGLSAAEITALNQKGAAALAKGRAFVDEIQSWTTGT
jgi:hypothetical protein